MSDAAATGPLAGLRVLEIESIGPGPFASMLLADLGANVLRIARPIGADQRKRNPVLERSRSGTLHLDLKSSADRERLLGLIHQADALIEGFRPGVMERLGLGPEDCSSRNPRLVYGRVTGWGRSGPLAKTAGHDINYIALTGALFACGSPKGDPIPPLNLVGDFGGGGLMLALGMVAGLFEARGSGRGQVVDAPMVTGAGLLMSMIYGLKANGQWPAPRGGNLLDGSAYFYRCYRCACGGWMAVGAIEQEFRRLFLKGLGLEGDYAAIAAAGDANPATHARIEALFLAQPRARWEEIFAHSDACVTPVLGLDEVVDHAQNRAARSFDTLNGAIHPMPVPHFSRTTLAHPRAAAEAAAVNLAQWELGGDFAQ